jgi:hypothetical protein
MACDFMRASHELPDDKPPKTASDKATAQPLCRTRFGANGTPCPPPLAIPMKPIHILSCCQARMNRRAISFCNVPSGPMMMTMKQLLRFTALPLLAMMTPATEAAQTQAPTLHKVSFDGYSFLVDGRASICGRANFIPTACPAPICGATSSRR